MEGEGDGEAKGEEWTQLGRTGRRARSGLNLGQLGEGRGVDSTWGNWVKGEEWTQLGPTGRRARSGLNLGELGEGRGVGSTWANWAKGEEWTQLGPRVGSHSYQVGEGRGVDSPRPSPSYQLVLHFLYGASPTSQLVLNFLYGAETKFCIFVWEAQLGLAQEVGKILYGSWQVKNFKVPDSQSLHRAPNWF